MREQRNMRLENKWRGESQVTVRIRKCQNEIEEQRIWWLADNCESEYQNVLKMKQEKQRSVPLEEK